MLACRPDRAFLGLIQVLPCGFVIFQCLVRSSDFASGIAVEVARMTRAAVRGSSGRHLSAVEFQGGLYEPTEGRGSTAVILGQKGIS